MTSTPKTSAERVSALRQRREALGLVRLEIYAHPADHAAIKKKAADLERKRTGTATSAKPPRAS